MPIFLSQVPSLFQKKLAPMDVALIQTSLPDEHGFMSFGISVDIVKAAAENAAIVIAQVNARIPRVLGDTFINIKDVDFIIPCDEPLLEFEVTVADDIAQKIGAYVARIVQDGDTIQVGSALGTDLSGQATAESLGKTFYNGIGGQADFMRGAIHYHAENYGKSR